MFARMDNSDALGYSQVSALSVYEGKLIIGGVFTSAGGVDANYIASWDGTYMKPLGSGMDDDVNALIIFDKKLIAGGKFDKAGNTPANGIAYWDL